MGRTLNIVGLIIALLAAGFIWIQAREAPSQVSSGQPSPSATQATAVPSPTIPAITAQNDDEGNTGASATNIQRPRHSGLEYTLLIALLALAIIHLFLILTPRRCSEVAECPDGQPGESPAHTRVGLVLIAVGLWTFVVVSLGGFGAVSAANTPLLTVTPISIRVVATAAFVAVYAVAVLWVRHRWILRPSAQLAVGSTTFPDGPGLAYPPVSLFSDGYFLHEYQVSKSNWIQAIKDTADDPAKLRFEAERAYAEAEGIKSLKSSREALEGMLSGSKEMDSDQTRHHALVIAMRAPDFWTTTHIYIGKVQNQLLVFTFLLLGAAAVFGVLGWGLPMAFGAAAAIVFRIRALTPLGDKKSFDGGARWMALFSTPLTGAVSAVLGLIVLSALRELGIVGDKVVIGISNMGGPSSDPLIFKPLALAFAVAFGWSAKLLDTMLGKLTKSVEGTKDDDKDCDETDDSGKPADGKDGKGSTTPPKITETEIIKVSQAVTKRHPRISVKDIRKNPDGTFNVDCEKHNAPVRLSVSDDFSAVTVLKK